MKTPEEYLKEVYLPSANQEDWKLFCLTNEWCKFAFEAIKKAQIDAIEETCKVCAKMATVKDIGGPGTCFDADDFIVCEDSILDCAEILKKEII